MNRGLYSPTFRQVLSDVDILAVAEISQFTDLSFGVVPEPAPILLLVFSLLAARRLVRVERIENSRLPR